MKIFELINQKKMINQGFVDEQREQQRIARKLTTESERLENAWRELNEQLGSWRRIVDDALGKMKELDKATSRCQLALNALDDHARSLPPVEQLRLDELSQAQCDSRQANDLLAQVFLMVISLELRHLILFLLINFTNRQTSIVQIRMHVDDVNDWSGRLQAEQIQLSPETAIMVDCCNQRFTRLRALLRVRLAALQQAMSDFGPSSKFPYEQLFFCLWLFIVFFVSRN